MPNQLSAIKGIFSDYEGSLLSRYFQREIFFDDAKSPFLYSYEGLFNHRHLPRGRGTYTFADGTILQGTFEMASMTSTGIIEAIKLLPSGERRIGLFEEGKLKLNVPARLFLKSLTYQGFVNSLEAPHGEGCILFNGRVICRGEFLDGMLVTQISLDQQLPLALPLDWREIKIPVRVLQMDDRM